MTTLKYKTIKEKLYDKVYHSDNFKIAEISTKDICFEEKVKLKCFYCNNYNKKWTCPPKIPQVDYKKIIQEECTNAVIVCYTEAISEDNFEIIRYRTTNKIHEMLLNLEKIFYTENVIMCLSFIGGSCKLCKNGCNELKCNNPVNARISMEGAGINVIKTVKKAGMDVIFPVKNELSRYGLLLWEEQ